MVRRRCGIRTRGGRRRGIALADAIIGGVMLGAGLAVVLSVTSQATRRQIDGERRLTAAWLADELLAMVLVEGPDDFDLQYDTSGRFDEPFGDFFYEIQIEDIGRDLPYAVTATVSWESGPGVKHVEVETRIAQSKAEEPELREPYEPVDREARYYDDEQP
jgi:hypothetical protein